VHIQGFGFNAPGDDDDTDDLESIFGGQLKDLSQVQVGDAAREVSRR
jgi:hypothetical protein